MVNVVNLNFGETNHCVFIASSSFGLPHTLCSSFICASATIYLVVLFQCVQGRKIYLLAPTEVLHQVVFVLELEKGEEILFCADSAWNNRSDQLVGLAAVLRVRPV